MEVLDEDLIKELDDELKKDPSLPNLAVFTDAGHAFSVPWSSETRSILSGLESSLMKSDAGPWLPTCPFDTGRLSLTTVIPEMGGGTNSFSKAVSTHTASSTEHLSAALGLTVGYPFLNATVSGKYDSLVLANTHGTQASRNSSCRVGHVVLDRSPPLAALARKLIKSKDGVAAFRKMYGDYYVCGYELGANAGVCMSASTSDTSSKVTLEVTISVDVLGLEESTTHTEETTEASASTSLSVYGYDTFENSTQSCSTTSRSASEQQALHVMASELSNKLDNLQENVRKQMTRLGLKDGGKIPFGTCGAICKSGLVVQLLLAPYARLNDYIALQ